MKLKNSFSWQLAVVWGWIALCSAVIISISAYESSLSSCWFYVSVCIVLGVLYSSRLKNTYEIKDGDLHIHELTFWFLHYDYRLPIKNIDDAKMIWQMQFPIHALCVWVGDAKYTLNADDKVSILLLTEINRLKQEEEHV